jgi:hypothetical protein
MNKKLQRLNEARHYEKRIRDKFGKNARICDCIDGWYIYTPVRVNAGIFGFEDRVHWRGANLRDLFGATVQTK